MVVRLSTGHSASTTSSAVTDLSSGPTVTSRQTGGLTCWSTILFVRVFCPLFCRLVPRHLPDDKIKSNSVDHYSYHLCTRYESLIFVETRIRRHRYTFGPVTSVSYELSLDYWIFVNVLSLSIPNVHMKQKFHVSEVV